MKEDSKLSNKVHFIRSNIGVAVAVHDERSEPLVLAALVKHREHLDPGARLAVVRSFRLD